MLTIVIVRQRFMEGKDMVIAGSVVWGSGMIHPRYVQDAVVNHVDLGGEMPFEAYVSTALLDRIIEGFSPMWIGGSSYPAPGLSESELVIQTDYGRLLIHVDDTLDPDVMEFRTADA